MRPVLRQSPATRIYYNRPKSRGRLAIHAAEKTIIAERPPPPRRAVEPQSSRQMFFLLHPLLVGTLRYRLLSKRDQNASGLLMHMTVL